MISLSAHHVVADVNRTIVVSIPPMQYIMQRLVGDEITVVSLLPAQASPEIFEPSPKQILLVKQSELYFSLGLPFEQDWYTVVSDDGLVIVEHCCDDLMTIQHGHHGPDPHIWTDPVLNMKIAERMYLKLSELYPENNTRYKQAFDELENELAEVDRYIQDIFKNKIDKYFLVSHPAWSYFAKRYDLQQISIEQEGKETGIKARKELIDLAKTNHIKTVFVIKHVNDKSANLFADEIDAKIIELDPLAFEHISNLKLTAELIADTFSDTGHE